MSKGHQQIIHLQNMQQNHNVTLQEAYNKSKTTNDPPHPHQGMQTVTENQQYNFQHFSSRYKLQIQCTNKSLPRSLLETACEYI